MHQMHLQVEVFVVYCVLRRTVEVELQGAVVPHLHTPLEDVHLHQADEALVFRRHCQCLSGWAQLKVLTGSMEPEECLHWAHINILGINVDGALPLAITVPTPLVSYIIVKPTLSTLSPAN
jgi:hypothetical protein